MDGGGAKQPRAIKHRAEHYEMLRIGFALAMQHQRTDDGELDPRAARGFKYVAIAKAVTSGALRGMVGNDADDILTLGRIRAVNRGRLQELFDELLQRAARMHESALCLRDALQAFADDTACIVAIAIFRTVGKAVSNVSTCL